MPVRIGVPHYDGALADVVRNPRSATAMGLLEEARSSIAQRELGAAAAGGSVKTLVGRMKDWFMGNF